jgi:hypothetical protein
MLLFLVTIIMFSFSLTCFTAAHGKSAGLLCQFRMEVVGKTFKVKLNPQAHAYSVKPLCPLAL